MGSATEEKALGNSAFQSKDYTTALEHFTKAITLTPGDHVLYSNRSGAYANLNDFSNALKDAKKCVELKPDWAKGYTRLGLAQFKMRNVREAEEAYQAGLQLDPSSAALKEGLQHIKNMSPNGNAREQEGISIDPQKIALLLQLDPRFTHLQQDKEFVNSLQHALKDPNQLQSLIQKDMRYAELIMASLEEPNGSYSEPHRSPPQESKRPKAPEPPPDLRTDIEKEGDALKDEANALYKAKFFDEALAKYDEAIAKNPNEILYQGNKAAVYMEMEKYQDCLDECQKALDRRYEVKADYIKVARIYNRMAACYLRQHLYDEAIKMYEKALCEDNNRQTRNALNECKREKEKHAAISYQDPEKAEEHRQNGNELFKKHDYPAAKKEYDEAIGRNPSDARLYSNRAACLCKLLEYPSALSDCEKAISIDPKFSKAYSRRGFCQLQMKDYNKALKTYQDGLKIDPDNEEMKNGFEAVLMKIQQSTQSSDVDEDQAKKAMQDPEIQQILADPQMQLILQQMTQNPQTAREAMADPQIAARIQKLAAAGILKMR